MWGQEVDGDDGDLDIDDDFTNDVTNDDGI